MTTITADHYRRALEGFGRRVDAVAEDQWNEPTRCCPEWAVRDLVAHVVEETAWAPGLLSGDAPGDVAERIGPDPLGDDPVGSWTRAAREAADAAVGAHLDGMVTLPSGKMPAREYLAELFCDTLIHTWDFAHAVGGDERLDPELVEVCAEWFDHVEDEWRERGAIGPPAYVPDGAGPQATLLARFGRTSRPESLRRGDLL